MTSFCFDFGNTRLKCGIFKNDQLIEVIVIEENKVSRQIKELIEIHKPERSILSSVVNHDYAVEMLLTEKTSFHKLSAESKLPISTPVGKPETIGADRLALAAGVAFFHGGKNNLVIGLGSCITYNFINQKNEFLGGSISPGMEMRFRALKEFTAKLPLETAADDIPDLGYDTRTNIQSGVVTGMARELDGFIELYSNKFGNFNALLTGGDAAYFFPRLKNKIFADPNLIFKGLYAISEQNNETKT